MENLTDDNIDEIRFIMNIAFSNFNYNKYYFASDDIFDDSIIFELFSAYNWNNSNLSLFAKYCICCMSIERFISSRNNKEFSLFIESFTHK